jgi:hypothetical protein
MSKTELTIDHLDDWIEWLKTVTQDDSKRLKSRLLRSAGLQALNRITDYTPRRSGRLQNSLMFGTKDNCFELKIGRVSFVLVGTVVEYAAAVEKGSKQRAGRFVPGFWRNGVFHYQPGAKTGMVLTGAKIEGAHMFEKGMDTMVNEDLSRIAEFELRRLWNELQR